MLKDKFSNFESPYNHKDWEDFKKELPKSTHSVFSPKNLFKFLIIATTLIVPLSVILHFTSKNENRKETLSDIKQINKQENNNHNSDNNTLLNQPVSKIANNNIESKSSKANSNSENSSLNKPNLNQPVNNIKTNSTNSSNENSIINKSPKDKSNNFNPFNEDIISADVDGGCAPLNIQFSPLISSDTILYLWNFNDGKSSTKMAPSHVFNNAGSYNISLSVKFAKSGIKKVYSKIINVKNVPVAKFDYSLDTQSDNISFTDNSSEAISWLWTFGDNSSSTEQNPQHEYKHNGIYDVQLIIKNGAGCSDKYSNKISVKLINTYFIPNAFSPNGDGKDDYFGPVGNDLNPDGYNFVVYNKTGKLVFETNNIKVKWDGKIKGTNTDAPPDIYFWKIIMKDKNGILQERSGNVTLVRFEQ